MTFQLRRAQTAPGSVFRRALGKAAQPEPVLTVAEWAEQRRFVAAESGSPVPGKWRNAQTPQAVEIMDCLDPEHPSRTVTCKIASQMFKSEVGLNWIGYTIDADPVPMGLALPSQNEVQVWNQTKWEPARDCTPAIKGKVFDVVDRSSKGSTTKFKRFRGGFLSCISASSSKELQGKSVKRGIADEISEMLSEVGDRGDPLKQFITRSDAHEDAKFLLTSTPGELPNCRISKYHEAGDQREYYVPCPDCGEWQTIGVERLHRMETDRAALACLGCGVLINETHKLAMLQGWFGRDNFKGWLKRYPSADPANPQPPEHFPEADLARWIKARGASSQSEGRQPSFWMHQAYSPFKPWARLLDECAEAERGTQEDKRVHQQQKLALAWDPSIDAPDHAKLFEIRGEYVTRGLVPEWACLIVGAADVQNDRIEWAAYAFGPDCSQGLIDWGICEGDTLTDEPFMKLREVIARRFEGEATQPLTFDRFGIDARGGKGRTAKVYQFVRSMPGVFALMGAKDQSAMPFEAGKIMKKPLSGRRWVKARVDWVGGNGVKKTIMGMLDRAIEASEAKERLERAFYAPFDAPEEIFRQLTAEVYKQPKTKRSGALGFWEKLSGRANEHLDLAVYAYALAWDYGLERMSPAEWARLMAARRRPSVDMPLFDRPHIAAQPAPQQNLNNPREGHPAADAGQAVEKAPPPDAAAGAIEQKPAPKGLGANPSPAKSKPGWMKRLSNVNRAARDSQGNET